MDFPVVRINDDVVENFGKAFSVRFLPIHRPTSYFETFLRRIIFKRQLFGELVKILALFFSILALKDFNFFVQSTLHIFPFALLSLISYQYLSEDFVISLIFVFIHANIPFCLYFNYSFHSV